MVMLFIPTPPASSSTRTETLMAKFLWNHSYQSSTVRHVVMFSHTLPQSYHSVLKKGILIWSPTSCTCNKCLILVSYGTTGTCIQNNVVCKVNQIQHQQCCQIIYNGPSKASWKCKWALFVGISTPRPDHKYSSGLAFCLSALWKLVKLTFTYVLSQSVPYC